jgi:hypothetical protein
VTPFDLALAVAAPLLAIVVEALPIPGKDYLTRNAAALRDANGLPDHSKELIAENAAGAVALAGVTPTLVSYLVSLFALFKDLSYALPYIFVFFVLGVVLAILLSAAAHNRSPFDIATKGVLGPYGLLGRLKPPPPLARIIHWTIYLVNALLILLAALIYAHALPAIAV